MAQAFFQCDKAPDPAIAVLKGMNLFKLCVERNNIVYRHFWFAVVPRKELLHFFRNFARRCCFLPAHHIRPFLILPDGEPGQRRILRIVF